MAVNDVGASSSSSHNILNRTAAGSAELGSTPVNFPGMHYSRFAAPGETSDVSSLLSRSCSASAAIPAHVLKLRLSLRCIYCVYCVVLMMTGRQRVYRWYMHVMEVTKV